jgi:hypothetical protein
MLVKNLFDNYRKRIGCSEEDITNDLLLSSLESCYGELILHKRNIVEKKLIIDPNDNGRFPICPHCNFAHLPNENEDFADNFPKEGKINKVVKIRSINSNLRISIKIGRDFSDYHSRSIEFLHMKPITSAVCNVFFEANYPKPELEQISHVNLNQFTNWMIYEIVRSHGISRFFNGIKTVGMRSQTVGKVKVVYERIDETFGMTAREAKEQFIESIRKDVGIVK